MLIRSCKEEERREKIAKYKAITDENLKSNVNFYEKLPYIEEKVKSTLSKLNRTNDYYTRMKNSMFGYNNFEY